MDKGTCLVLSSRKATPAGPVATTMVDQRAGYPSMTRIQRDDTRRSRNRADFPEAFDLIWSHNSNRIYSSNSLGSASRSNGALPLLDQSRVQKIKPKRTLLERLYHEKRNKDRPISCNARNRGHSLHALIVGQIRGLCCTIDWYARVLECAQLWILELNMPSLALETLSSSLHAAGGRGL